MSLRKDRVSWGRLKRAHNIVATKYHFAVPPCGAAFCAHEVITSVSLIQMWCFDPDRLRCYVDAAIHNNFTASGNHLVVLRVIFPDLDHSMTLVEFFTCIWRIVVNDVCLAIVIKKD